MQGHLNVKLVGISFPTFRDNLSVPSSGFKNPKNNKKHPRREHFFATSRRKPGIMQISYLFVQLSVSQTISILYSDTLSSPLLVSFKILQTLSIRAMRDNL